MHQQFHREDLNIKPLVQRCNKLDIQRDHIDPAHYPVQLTPEAQNDVDRVVQEIKRAKDLNAARILAFGAHSIKNGLGPVLIRLMEGGWITHFATNGAGIIHDWEFSFQGKSGEDVQRYTNEGQFGIWRETGAYINLSILIGAWHGLGYGESVGTMIDDQGLTIPDTTELREAIITGTKGQATYIELETAAAAADLLAIIKNFNLPSGFMKIEHPHRHYSLAWSAKKNDVPFTCHPMFGHDIIYTHPLNDGAAIGRTAQRDFLSFVDSVSRLQGGVYLSVGSAIMSPMIFEKSLSMSRNLAFLHGKNINDFSIHVVDLAHAVWDWNQNGEPPMDNPAYYLRYCKTFSRMGGRMTYCSADNRSWLVALLNKLENNF